MNKTALILTSLLSAVAGGSLNKTSASVLVDTNPVPFCQEWNTSGDKAGGEAATPGQRMLLHLGHFLTKSDFVRMTLNQHYDDNLFVDLVVTCYEERTPVLVDQVDVICLGSNEDKKDEINQAFSDYLNVCIREVEIKLGK